MYIKILGLDLNVFRSIYREKQMESESLYSRLKSGFPGKRRCLSVPPYLTPTTTLQIPGYVRTPAVFLPLYRNLTIMETIMNPNQFDKFKQIVKRIADDIHGVNQNLDNISICLIVLVVIAVVGVICC